MIKLLIFSFCSLSFISGNEPVYKFINDISKNDVMDMEIITDFSQGGFNYVSNFSGRISTDYEGRDGADYKFTQTWNNIISTFKRNDELKINHDAQKLNGTQYIIIADTSGNFSREGLDENAKEMEEQNQAFMFFSSQGNIFFPFGSDSLHEIGETWTVDSDEHLDEFPGFESASIDMNYKTVYTFNKVKKKKGKMIAYISAEEELIMNMMSATWDETWEMDVVGVFKSKFQYNLTDKKVMKCRMRGTVRGEGRDLEDDSSISFNQNIDMLCKTKLK